MHSNDWISMTVICMLTACSQGADEIDSSLAASSASAEQSSLTVRPSSRVAREAVLKEPEYVAQRALAREELQRLDQQTARGLQLSSRETTLFLRIMTEHHTARLAMQDFFVANTDLTREQREKELRVRVPATMLEAASPALLQRRILLELGEPRLRAYRELRQSSKPRMVLDRLSETVEAQQVEVVK